MNCGLAAMLFLAVRADALAHRLDEYLQGAILSVEKNRLEIQMTLTPGVAVFPALISHIDIDADGTISEVERRAYADAVLRDLLLTLDGKSLTPHAVSMGFPTANEMKEGHGEIRLEFDAELPSGGRNRVLTLDNHHESQISAYQVNCLAPRDPDIRITSQVRNFSQSSYRLNYARADVGSGIGSAALWFGGFGWLGLTALFLANRLRSLNPKVVTIQRL